MGDIKKLEDQFRESEQSPEFQRLLARAVERQKRGMSEQEIIAGAVQFICMYDD